ncbi:hypothetical protein KPH14_006795 [Odynerus spinipes]|uniref:Transmembrane protein 234 homolog n=1 Tax=Odynerus spinipes TaxID=1348599 RepID=A0AAD9RRJ7_9HYME|nr:hypothetical protein KPH14_006795 [Odynerus spinipes]
MAVTIESLMYLVLVALLWGVTNPLIKRGAAGLENVKAPTKYGQVFKELSFLVTNMKYMVPFLVNQLGSVLYFVALQGADMSLAVPVSNALTFEVTAVTGWILGEKTADRNTYIGMILILIGTTLSCWDKLYA